MLCALVAFSIGGYALDRTDKRRLTAAFVVVLVADYFLILGGKFLIGVGVFLVVHGLFI